MPKFVWTEANSVGIEDIDKQHQHFFELANSIIDLAERKDANAHELRFKLTELSDYGVYHLLTEETLFKTYAYPHAEEHVAAHDAYREKMAAFADEMEKGGVDTGKFAERVAGFAGDWLMSHITVADKKYTGFMHEQGIS